MLPAALIFDILAVIVTLHDRHAVATRQVESYTQIPILILTIAGAFTLGAAISSWRPHQRGALLTVIAFAAAGLITRILWNPDVGNRDTNPVTPQPPPPTIVFKPGGPADTISRIWTR